jgi:hypothetical protein
MFDDKVKFVNNYSSITTADLFAFYLSENLNLTTTSTSSCSKKVKTKQTITEQTKQREKREKGC